MAVSGFPVVFQLQKSTGSSSGASSYSTATTLKYGIIYVDGYGTHSYYASARKTSASFVFGVN